jgi:heavy metal translocating P-type ATPase
MTRRRGANGVEDAAVDVALSLPRDGRIHLESRYLFADPGAALCRRFVRMLFELDEIRTVEVVGGAAQARIEYAADGAPSHHVVAKIGRHLRSAHRNGDADTLGELSWVLAGGAGFSVERHGARLSTWRVVHELPGRIRLRNDRIRGRKRVCAALEAALERVPGVARCRTNARIATALIVFDPERIDRPGIVDALDRALLEPERPGDEARLVPGALAGPPGQGGAGGARPHAMSGELKWSRRNFMILAGSVVVSALGFVYPPLGWLGAAGTLYGVSRTFLGVIRTVVRTRRPSVDGLVVTIQLVTLGYGQFFIFSLTGFVWPASRYLLNMVKNDSRAHYTDVFRLQARTVWVRVDGVDVEVPLEAVKVGDLVAVSTGQTIPVDGHVAEGVATVDQQVLTGEAAPAEKTAGDPVFALTVVLSGRIAVRVEKTGAATAAAHIARVLDRTVDFKTGRQLRAERVAEGLVVPAFVAGLLAWPVLGFGIGAALVDAHPKQKATMASSFGLLGFFRIAAREGLLIKDGRTLELLSGVDTVVFDKTGTLTLAQPHVACIHRCGDESEDHVLGLAAAAEQRQSHPIARAILHAAGARGLAVPPAGDAEYTLGYGLAVAVDGVEVRVGSARYVEAEGVALPAAIVEAQARCHEEGHSLVLVAAGGTLAGAIELHSTIRPEARAIVDGLRRRGITSMYVISGDHEVPTRRLAETLGIERYFAETLPENKAALIERLQASGRVVCYVGDGINDSIAMKKAQVSVSLRGASTVATDTAEVILLDESLIQLGRLFDLAREHRRNMTLTLTAVFVPSALCLAAVLFGAVGFVGARYLNIIGLVTGVGAAMLPLATHRATEVEPGLAVTGP